MEGQHIPEKLYFKIGEVSKIVGVKPYVLRYWETEFKEIGPIKSRSNQRLYRRRDVEILLMIKQLLYKEGFTISGARKKVRDLQKDHTKKAAPKNNGGAKGAKLAESQVGLPLGGEINKKWLLKLKKELLELRTMVRAGA